MILGQPSDMHGIPTFPSNLNIDSMVRNSTENCTFIANIRYYNPRIHMIAIVKYFGRLSLHENENRGSSVEKESIFLLGQNKGRLH